MAGCDMCSADIIVLFDISRGDDVHFQIDDVCTLS